MNNRLTTSEETEIVDLIYRLFYENNDDFPKGLYKEIDDAVGELSEGIYKYIVENTK